VTIDEFRAIPTYTAKMRELLSDPVAQVALTTLIDHNKPAEALDHEPEIVSVRRHSRGVGWDNAVRALLLLGDTKLPEKKEPEEPRTYGTGIPVESVFTQPIDSDIIQPQLT
jgi:hypothetical protein